MSDESVEKVPVLLEVDDAPLPATATVSSGDGRWMATIGLPKWTTPGKIVSVQGGGSSRAAALQDAIKNANGKLAEYKQAREVDRRRQRSKLN